MKILHSLDSVHFEHDFAFKPENNYDLFLAKYDAAGTLNWVQTIQGVNSCSITGVVAHSNTNVFVSGYFSTNITLGPVNLNASNTHGFMVMLGDDIVNVNEVYNSNSKDKLIVGPIPSSGVVNFELGNNQFGVIEIYNLQGQMVQTIECFENGASVDLNHLMKGVYVAKRNSSSGVLTAKFILE